MPAAARNQTGTFRLPGSTNIRAAFVTVGLWTPGSPASGFRASRSGVTGSLFLREPLGRRRSLAAAIVAAGMIVPQASRRGVPS